MKQSIAVKAYLSAKKLNSQDASPKTAKVFFELFRKLQPAWDFQVQEEQKIFEKHPKLNPMTGKIKIENSSDENERKEALAEIKIVDKEFKDLEDVETTIDFEKVVINSASENLKLSGEDIANLEQFVEFI